MEPQANNWDGDMEDKQVDAVIGLISCLKESIQGDPLDLASRGCEIKVQNHTEHTLEVRGSNCSHGAFVGGANDPRRIDAWADHTWDAESRGVATGVEGYVKYSIGGTGHFLIVDFNNPFIGASTYSARIEGANHEKQWQWKVERVEGNSKGDTAHMGYLLYENPDYTEKLQAHQEKVREYQEKASQYEENAKRMRMLVSDNPDIPV